MIDPTALFHRQWEDMDPATNEINRLSDLVEDQCAEILALKNHIRILIAGGMRNPDIIRPKIGRLHPMTITITKGQILDANEASKLETPPQQ